MDEDDGVARPPQAAWLFAGGSGTLSRNVDAEQWQQGHREDPPERAAQKCFCISYPPASGL